MLDVIRADLGMIAYTNLNQARIFDKLITVQANKIYRGTLQYHDAEVYYSFRLEVGNINAYIAL